MIGGIKVVKSLGVEKRDNLRFLRLFRNLLQRHLAAVKIQARCSITGDTLGGFMSIAALGIGSHLIWSNTLSIGEFVAFLSYLAMVLGPVNNLANFAPVLAEGLAGLARIESILGHQAESRDGSIRLNQRTVEGRVRFERVTFDYSGLRPCRVMENFNLDIQAGQTVALVGPSGSGKSTIANLLLRFYEPTRGRVTIDGHDLWNLDPVTLRKTVGVVLQEPTLFTGTIADNISYGSPDATPEDIERAARMAHAHGFISELNDGYETAIGERGVSLSGGQKQRIAIARTLLVNPPILILDEATSALDNQSERSVQAALDDLMGSRTTIVIAHRLSIIRNADRIVVMDKGKVVEDGPHHELMDRGGLYASLHHNEEPVRA